MSNKNVTRQEVSQLHANSNSSSSWQHLEKTTVMYSYNNIEAVWTYSTSRCLSMTLYLTRVCSTVSSNWSVERISTFSDIIIFNFAKSRCTAKRWNAVVSITLDPWNGFILPPGPTMSLDNLFLQRYCLVRGLLNRAVIACLPLGYLYSIRSIAESKIWSSLKQLIAQ